MRYAVGCRVRFCRMKVIVGWDMLFHFYFPFEVFHILTQINYITVLIYMQKNISTFAKQFKIYGFKPSIIV